MDEPDTKRRAGRPSTAVLTPERIIDAAYLVADRAGGNFTIAGIARTLGVKPPAIYNYFTSKDDVIAGMRGQLTLRIGDHGFDRLPWYEAVLPWARAYLEVLGRSPGTIAALATHPVDSEPASIADYERIVQSMRRAGAPEALVVPALVALESFIIGSALDALAPEVNMRPERSPERAPGLLRAEELARESARERGLSMARGNFEFGLSALVAGLRMQFGESYK
ncbi:MULTISPECIES: TetR/AcrR family transcriptional regulator [unclassified Leucobacter]|uniref:TetR/AcrR family transcriptional regulator n=1 Tax=unclassified Leucobacter TaxID=2621730 RepID=UPI00165E8322|nr:MULTISPECIES: TetR/AcrR family transcriptional regulator [unclassified Leucobacter]MBC9927109.1 TetR/AcrR family transcriptional regulator [Leucobacter sp. cx-169]MBC9936390.1 TetR/AcrR family transcriptional regulator [Leucobacter sp. cx-87]